EYFLNAAFIRSNNDNNNNNIIENNYRNYYDNSSLSYFSWNRFGYNNSNLLSLQSLKHLMISFQCPSCDFIQLRYKFLTQKAIQIKKKEIIQRLNNNNNNNNDEILDEIEWLKSLPKHIPNYTEMLKFNTTS
ncbi:hypothetical protein RFI_05488, partial [Reticulomyxa filosa]